MRNRSEYFRNRKFKVSEQTNHWKNNWRNGALRLLERILIRGNVSDLLGGNLSHISHLPEVNMQLKSLNKVKDGEILPELRISPVGSNFSVKLNEVLQPQFLLELESLKVDVRSGLAQIDSGFVIDSTLVQWQRLLFRGGMSHSVARLSKKLPSKSGIWTVLPFSPFYFHTLVEDIPQVLAARRFNKEVKIITSSRNPKWTFELLNALGIEFETTKENAFRFEHYIAVTSPRGISSSNVALIKSSVIAMIQSSGERRLFLSRGKTLDRSDSALEDEVMKLLSTIGFESIDPSTMSVSEQIEVFSTACAIVGLHGGAMTNIIWCNEGTQVIEIYNHPYRTHDFARLAAACRHDYSCLDLRPDSTNEEIARSIYELLTPEKE